MRAGILVLSVLVGVVSSDPVRAASSVEKQMGPQVFAEKSVESIGGSDSLLTVAVDAAVLTARKYQFYYDASGSGDGRVIVKALWKGDPIVLTMRFFRKDAAIYVASATQQTAKTFMNKGGQKIEDLFYSHLAQETKQRGIQLFSDSSAKP